MIVMASLMFLWGYALDSSGTICCGWVMAEYPRTVLEFRDWFADDARQPGTNGRLEGLQRAGPARVSAQDRPLQCRGGREPVATGQPGGVAVEAMAAGHASRSGQRHAPRLLPG